MQPVPVTDYILLSIMGFSVLGLLLALQLEALGGGIAIAGVFIHFVAFRIIRDEWYFPHLVLPGLFFIIPGVMFLLCSRQQRNSDLNKDIKP